MGLKGGINHFSYNLSTLSSTDPDDYLFGQERISRFLPNLGLGAYFYSPTFYLGLSVPKLLRNNLHEDQQGASARQSREERHYFVIGGVVFPISENVMFKPAFVGKMVQGAPSSIDFNGTFILFKSLWLGAFYRYGDSVGAIAQVKVSKALKLGYSYDMTSSYLRNYQNGSHEILLSYNIYWGEGDVFSPRFF
jgi:type IX secretion system PorP/SprF family membrane protein